MSELGAVNSVGSSSCSGGGPSEAGGRSADKFNWWKISLPCCFHLTVCNNLPRTRCAVTSFAGFSAFCSLREELPMLSSVQPNFPYENLGPRPSALEVAPLVLQIHGFESCYWPQGKLENGIVSSQSHNGVRGCSASREYCTS